MRWALRTLLGVALLAFAAGSGVAWWMAHPLQLDHAKIEFYLPVGTGTRAAARRMVDAGVETDPLALGVYLRLAARDRPIQAGEYALQRGATPRDLLGKLLRGERMMRSVTFIEGWTFAQVRAALAAVPYLKHDTADLSDAALMDALGRPGQSPEGRFFPDTYQYARGSSELAILKEAMHMMDQRLAAAWDEREPGLPLRSPDQALILASIVEKETGHEMDRATVAGVFINRLKRDMPLQTDPTVIYGLGAGYGGTLTQSDLKRDTPFNTYLRRGLPPTPIAMPGNAALLAAVRPEHTDALYFVARGDGSSEFSNTLGDHHRAVDKYLRGGKQP